MNEFLLKQIQEICPYVFGIRNMNGYIEVRINRLDEEQFWFSLWQAPSKVQEYVWRYLRLGGKIE